MPEQKNLKEVARVFLKLGIIGFGGPAAHIAMMRNEIVAKRQWITEEHFLDLIGATNLIPGPNSTEMAIHCGHERAGWRGLIVAGCCFILPAVIITGCIAYAYQLYGNLPAVAPFLYGTKPAIIAVIFSVMYGLGKKSLKSAPLVIIGLACLAASALGLSEFMVLFGAGFVGMALQWFKTSRTGKTYTFAPLALLQPSVLKIFWIFLKIGSILYGSGYVLFAFLNGELVKTGMLTHKQLIDAIAVGQFTPGPVFSSATFIGWQMGGINGAIAATAGIFLPSFVFVALVNPLIPMLRKSALMAAFLDAVNVASIALILMVCYDMGRDTIHDWKSIAICLAGVLATFLFKNLNSAFIILGGALAGYLLTMV